MARSLGVLQRARIVKTSLVHILPTTARELIAIESVYTASLLRRLRRSLSLRNLQQRFESALYAHAPVTWRLLFRLLTIQALICPFAQMHYCVKDLTSVSDLQQRGKRPRRCLRRAPDRPSDGMISASEGEPLNRSPSSASPPA